MPVHEHGEALAGRAEQRFHRGQGVSSVVLRLARQSSEHGQGVDDQEARADRSAALDRGLDDVRPTLAPGVPVQQELDVLTLGEPGPGDHGPE